MTKKNFRKTPKKLLAKLALSADKNEFVAAVVLHIPKQDVFDGKWKKAGVVMENGKYVVNKFVPSIRAGKFSAVNRGGKVIVRKDLPMVTKTYSFDAPDYGDWSIGSHEVSFEKEVYQREKIAPRNLSIVPTVLREVDDFLVVSFQVEKPLKRHDTGFDDDMLFYANLLQENFGDCDLYHSDEPITESTTYKRLKWEVLPQGWWRDATQVEKITEKLGEKKAALFFERIKKIEALNPKESYQGESYLGNRLYFVYVFPNTVIAECPMFGNALYYLIGDHMSDWREIFVKTKRAALEAGAGRLLHLGSWEEKLKQLM